MNKNQIIAAAVVVAWVAYKMGQRNAAATAAATATNAVKAVDAATWDWLSAVGAM